MTYSYRQKNSKEREDRQKESGIRPRNCPEKQKDHDSDESESDANNEVSEINGKSRSSSRFQQGQFTFIKNSKIGATNCESDKSTVTDNASSEHDEINHENHTSSNKIDNSVSKENSTNVTNPNGSLEINIKNLSPRVTVYKSTFVKNSDVTRWNSALDSKGQKLHILHDSVDNLSSKKYVCILFLFTILNIHMYMLSNDFL